jgi:hypothetical protein
MTLVTFTQVDPGIVTADVGEIVSAPMRIRETQDINVVSKAARHIRDIQDRLRTFKPGSVHWPIFLAHPPQIKASMPCVVAATSLAPYSLTESSRAPFHAEPTQ